MPNEILIRLAEMRDALAITEFNRAMALETEQKEVSTSSRMHAAREFIPSFIILFRSLRIIIQVFAGFACT